MKELTIVSGKGGTGKTTLTAALASAGHGLILCDADVDAADLHLIADPSIVETHVFEGSWVAQVDPEKCSGCGICIEYCRFDAIAENNSGHLEINPFRCEGCRLCERLCPSHAISSAKSTNNSWYISETRYGTLVHAHMGPGEENSGKLVTRVRQKARELAGESSSNYILTDGPPGTGCPAIASITGTDAVVVVIEPSKTSLHDARRIIELVKGFKIPVHAILNKHDIYREMAEEVESYLQENDIPMIGKIPFDKSVVEAMIQKKSIIEYDPGSEISAIIQSAWNRLARAVDPT